MATYREVEQGTKREGLSLKMWYDNLNAWPKLFIKVLGIVAAALFGSFLLGMLIWWAFTASWVVGTIILVVVLAVGFSALITATIRS